jgi:aminopeptidase YwaD
VAFAGEEIGLLGSSHWVDHPTLPLDKAIAMINMDMIGRIRKSKVYVGGVGTGSTFESLLETASKHHDLRIDLTQTGYSSSDHTTFVGKRIPVLFFFSGLHADYHKPSDTWEKIDPENSVRVLDLVYRVAGELNRREERPLFVRVAEPHTAGASGGGGGYGPYFGSIPDFGQVENGVRFADIREGSPAGKAGLLAGDVLVEFDGKKIENLYDFTYALRARKPGDQVRVVVLREDRKISADVTLAVR